MLEGKSEKLESQEMLSSPHWKIEMSKNKTKIREPRKIENQRRMNEKREMNEKTMKNDHS